jgi:hypothetical protein
MYGRSIEGLRNSKGTLISNAQGHVELIPCGAQVPEARRGLLLERIDAIIATNWRSTRPHWSREHSPFHDDFGLALFHQDAEIIGYFIYQRLTLDGIPVFYGAGTAVLSSHQGAGCYQAMLGQALRAEWRAVGTGVCEIYFAWRTRSPAIWRSCASVCKAVAPSLADGKRDTALEDACRRLAGELYPRAAIEPPMMVMRNVYEHLTGIRETEHRRPDAIRARFSESIPNPADAIFSVGIVERTAWAEKMRATRFKRLSLQGGDTKNGK